MGKDSPIAFERLLLVMIEIFDQFQTIETLKEQSNPKITIMASVKLLLDKSSSLNSFPLNKFDYSTRLNTMES